MIWVNAGQIVFGLRFGKLMLDQNAFFKFPKRECMISLNSAKTPKYLW
jgi:hypothetical protein